MEREVGEGEIQKRAEERDVEGEREWQEVLNTDGRG